VLRYLYFGLAEREMPSQTSRSQTLTPTGHEKYPTFEHDNGRDTPQNRGFVTTTDQMAGGQSYFEPRHWSPEAHMSDSFSATPSPLLSPRPSNENITFDHWKRRYDIHNDAVSELYDSLAFLHTLDDASFLRYVMLPMVVLALVSLPGSHERALYGMLLQRFKDSMSSLRRDTNPIGGSSIDYDISWDALDGYSAEIKQQLRNSTGYVEPILKNAAPEWNWRHMLKRINLTSACKFLDRAKVS
jgi:hypothetical protein